MSDEEQHDDERHPHLSTGYEFPDRFGRDVETTETNPERHEPTALSQANTGTGQTTSPPNTQTHTHTPGVAVDQTDIDTKTVPQLREIAVARFPERKDLKRANRDALLAALR